MATKTPNVLTQREFGERIGCTHSMASRVLNGKRLPSFHLMEAIEREFGVPMKDQLAARRKGMEAYGALMQRRVVAATNAAARRA